MFVTFTIGNRSVGQCVTVRMPARLDPSTGRPAVTAAELGAACQCPVDRVLALAVAAQQQVQQGSAPPGDHPQAQVTVTGEVSNDAGERDGGGSPAGPGAGMGMGMGQPPSEPWDAPGGNGAEHIAHALLGVLSGIGGGMVRPPAPHRATAASPAGAEWGVAAALIDVDLAARVLAAEFEEATRNEASSRRMAALVRDAPTLLRRVVETTGQAGLTALLTRR